MNPLFALCQLPQSKIVDSERTEMEFEAHLIEKKKKTQTKTEKKYKNRKTT